MVANLPGGARKELEGTCLDLFQTWRRQKRADDFPGRPAFLSSCRFHQPVLLWMRSPPELCTGTGTARCGERRAKWFFFWILGGVITPRVEVMSAVYAGKSNEINSKVRSEMSKFSLITAWCIYSFGKVLCQVWFGCFPFDSIFPVWTWWLFMLTLQVCHHLFSDH